MWEMKLLLCVVKAGILQKCLHAEGVETTTHIILVGIIQGKSGDIIEMVNILVYGPFSYISVSYVIYGNT
jgi:hypothetical protein